MFDFEDAKPDITKEEILSKISEYQIFKQYCKNFEEVDKSFLSEFYIDTKPSCRIYITNNNNLCYKDFGTGEHYNCFDYISRKYNVNYYESLRIIAADFNLYKLKIDKSPGLIVSNDAINLPKKLKTKKRIEIVSQNFTSTDYDYWKQYEVPLDLLEEYNVFSAKCVYLYTSEKTIVFEYRKSNPIYAYRFVSDGKYSYKIYFPYADPKHKWLFSGGSSTDIEGYDQLRLNGEFIILTKSLKDCMCYRLLGIDAFSLQGEANKFDPELAQKILKRFNKIIVNYDNDEQGIKSANALKQRYGFDTFMFEGAKDLSDLIKEKGLDAAKLELKKHIKYE